MIFSKYRNLSRWVIIITSFGIISLILWNTYIFFQKFKAEERTKMEIWSAAQTQFLEILTSESSNDLNSSLETDLDLIFNTDVDKLWQSALALIGINDYRNISGIGHA